MKGHGYTSAAGAAGGGTMGIEVDGVFAIIAVYERLRRRPVPPLKVFTFSSVLLSEPIG